MKKNILEYKDIELLQYILSNLHVVGALDNEMLMNEADKLKLKLIAIRAEMEKQKEKLPQ